MHHQACKQTSYNRIEIFPIRAIKQHSDGQTQAHTQTQNIVMKNSILNKNIFLLFIEKL